MINIGFGRWLGDPTEIIVDTFVFSLAALSVPAPTDAVRCNLGDFKLADIAPSSPTDAVRCDLGSIILAGLTVPAPTDPE